MIKAVFNILLKYRSKFFLVFFIEIIYIFLLRYKGNQFKITNNKNFTDNIPTPYLFLLKIDKFLKGKKNKKNRGYWMWIRKSCLFFFKKESQIKNRRV